MKFKIKPLLLSFFFVIICIPLLTKLFGINQLKPLDSVSIKFRYEKLSLSNWLENSFQSSFSEYMNANLGYHAFFVRLRNQIDYSLFDRIHSKKIIKGEKDILFRKDYIQAYYGEDFVGHEEIQKNTLELKQLQEKLEERNKLLVFSFAIGKGSFYPEYFPDKRTRQTNNHDEYSRNFKTHKINHIDFVPWFLEMKKQDSLSDFLFPKNGIHWSYYSGLLSTDSMIGYFNQKKSWNLPRINITQKKYSLEPKFLDNDMGETINLLSDLKLSKPLIYPEFEWTKTEDRDKKILIVGDSFSWELVLNSGAKEECFDSLMFWFYNRSVFPSTKKGLPILARHIDLRKSLDYYDVFLLVSNEPNLSNFSSGFVHDALESFKDPNYIPQEHGNDRLKERIHQNKFWYEDIKQRAKRKNITIDSAISLYFHHQKISSK